MSPAVADRRVQRTLDALRAALLALMVEHDWEDISVQDICDRANVGRSTFYTHFEHKDALLLAGFDQLRKELRAKRHAHAAADRLGWVRGFIDHADEQRELFRALLGKRSGHLVHRRFRRMLVEQIKQDISPAAEPVAHYIAGAFFELLTWWIEARSSLSADDIERLFRKLTTPALAAA